MPNSIDYICLTNGVFRQTDVIDNAHLDDYRFAFEYLKNNEYDNEYTGFGIVTTYTMPLTFQYGQPTAMLFKKKLENDKLFTHIFVLFALNSIFQIILPFNKKDAIYYSIPEGIDTPWCPPLFGENNNDGIGNIIGSSINLNSTEKLYNQTESFIIHNQPDLYEKTQYVDKVTGEVKEREFDGNKIIGINLKRIEITS